MGHARPRPQGLTRGHGPSGHLSHSQFPGVSVRARRPSRLMRDRPLGGGVGGGDLKTGQGKKSGVWAGAMGQDWGVRVAAVSDRPVMCTGRGPGGSVRMHPRCAPGASRVPGAPQQREYNQGPGFSARIKGNKSECLSLGVISVGWTDSNLPCGVPPAHSSRKRTECPPGPASLLPAVWAPRRAPSHAASVPSTVPAASRSPMHNGPLAGKAVLALQMGKLGHKGVRSLAQGQPGSGTWCSQPLRSQPTLKGEKPASPFPACWEPGKLGGGWGGGADGNGPTLT